MIAVVAKIFGFVFSLFALAGAVEARDTLRWISTSTLEESREATFALGDFGPLGYYGPLGPYGPLGVIGPLGDRFWNPDLYFQFAGEWETAAELINSNAGPLTAAGPFGSQGSLNQSLWAQSSRLFLSNENFRPLAIFGALGVAGALGPLGPLGLGPIGAHGFARDTDGNYLNSEGKTVRNISIAWDEFTSRIYSLVESRRFNRNQSIASFDASVFIHGIPDEAKIAIRPENPGAQTLTLTLISEWASLPFPYAMAALGRAALLGFNNPPVVATPLGELPYDHVSYFDDFDLSVEVLNLQGNVAAKFASRSRRLVDWVQISLPAGYTLRVGVELHRAWGNDFVRNCWINPIGCVPSARLIVTNGKFTPESRAARALQIVEL